MRKLSLLGLVGLCLWSTTLQSCDKDDVNPNGCNNSDTTYVDSTGNGNGTDTTDWNNGDPNNGTDSTDWNGGGGGGIIDSTDWNGGNPNDSLPG